MKTLFTFVAAICLTAAGYCQTLEEIINLNTTAMGGKEKLATLNSVKMTGSMSAQGMDIPVTISKVHQKGMRVDMEIMGSSNYQILTADKGWTYMPVMGMQSPEELPADRVADAASQLDLRGMFMNYADKGTKIEYAGKEKVDKKEAYKLNITSKTGKSTTAFIDTKENRLLKTITKASVNGSDMEIETVFGDYKQNKDGFWFPYSISSTQGNFTFDSIETNVSFPESLFKN